MRPFIVLLGPPAVGKMTVGRSLEAALGLPLFHNHMTIEVVLPFFSFGTPQFRRLVDRYRQQLFDEAAASDLPGLLFTYACAFDQPSELRYLRRLHDQFAGQGWRVVFVELSADQQTRLARNRMPDRLAAKASKRDVASSDANLRDFDARYQMNSAEALPFGEHLRVDNGSGQTAAATAQRIIGALGLDQGPNFSS